MSAATSGMIIKGDPDFAALIRATGLCYRAVHPRLRIHTCYGNDRCCRFQRRTMTMAFGRRPARGCWPAAAIALSLIFAGTIAAAEHPEIAKRRAAERKTFT